MIAEFLENVDRFQRLRLLPTQQSLDFRRFDEQAVEFELESGKITEYDMLVLDGH